VPEDAAALEFREPRPDEREAVVALVVESFEPITWYRKVDERFGPPNGRGWSERFDDRVRDALAAQSVLVGEAEGRLATFAAGTLDPRSRMAFLDLLAVARWAQGRGWGRAALGEFERRMAAGGAEVVHLDCLIDNVAGDALYRAEGYTEMARQIRWVKKLT
jgi:ribosomal protein S18 acetylase RimI-like enzyme